MQVSYTSSGSVNLITKTSPVLISPGVTLAKYSIPGAGEYDVDAIQCEAINLSDSIVYFITTEDLTVTYLAKVSQDIIKLDDASATNILIVDLRSDDKPEDLKPILKSLEPSYLLLIGPGATEEMQDALGLPKLGNTVLKVTRSSLPLEGTFLVA